MNEILREENLCLEYVDVQWPIRDGRSKFADVVLWEKKPEIPGCVIEYKPPEGWSPYDAELTDDALFKATKIRPQARFFGTWNTNELVIWETYSPGAQSLMETRRGQFRISSIRTLDEIDKPDVERQVKEALRSFLRQFCRIYQGIEVLQAFPPDDFFIQIIRSTIDALYYPISIAIRRNHQRSAGFRRKLNQWFVEQSWLPPSSDEDFSKAARQHAYLLTDKVLFYNTLRIHYPVLKEIHLTRTVRTNWRRL